jgi:RND family efflux transporter MFP subunit
MRTFFPITLAAFAVSTACSAPASENAEPRPRSVESFRVVPATSASDVVYVGTVQAAQRSELSFLIGGSLVSLEPQIGDTFVADQTLGRVESTELNLAVEARAAELRDAEAGLADAQRNFDRFSALAGTGAVAQADIDSALARLDSARARADAARAGLAQARKRLADTALKAPYAGQVVERLVEPSQTLAAGQPVLRVIGSDQGLEAVLNIPSVAVDMFATGTETTLTLRPSGREIPARVIEVGNDAGRSGLFPVTLALDPTLAQSDDLRSGLRVEVAAPAPEQSDGFTIPLTAYRPEAGEAASVLVIDPVTGELSERAIVIGNISDRGASVLSGLEGGELIVARGLPHLRNGETVALGDAAIARFNQ